MHQLNPTFKKKLRGLKRRMRVLDSWVQSFIGFFPDRPERDDIWYTKPPIYENIVDNPRAKWGVRRAFITSLLDVCQYIRQSKSPKHPNARVVAVISLPDLFHSSADVFFTIEAYTSFTTRIGPDQIWTQLPNNRSLLKEWRLPYDMPEKGYYEEIHETWDNVKYYYTGEIWLVGDIDS